MKRFSQNAQREQAIRQELAADVELFLRQEAAEEARQAIAEAELLKANNEKRLVLPSLSRRRKTPFGNVLWLHSAGNEPANPLATTRVLAEPEETITMPTERVTVHL